MTKNDYIEIGKVVNTFGIKGELKIVSESDFVDYRYAVGKTIYLKLRNTIKVALDEDQEVVKKLAQEDEKVARHLEGKEIVKIIVVPNKIVNIVVK